LDKEVIDIIDARL